MVVALGGSGGLLSMWAGDALLALSPCSCPVCDAGIDWRTLGSLPARRPDHGGDRIVAAALDGQDSLAHDLREGAIEARGGATGRTLQRSSRSRSRSPSRCSSARRCSASFAALAKFDRLRALASSAGIQLPVVVGAQAAPQLSMRARLAGAAGRSARTSRRHARCARIGNSTRRTGRDLLFGRRHGRRRCHESAARVSASRLAGLRRDDRPAVDRRPRVCPDLARTRPT